MLTLGSEAVEESAPCPSTLPILRTAHALLGHCRPEERRIATGKLVEHRVELDRDDMVRSLREHCENDKADRAERELTKKVDKDKHQGLLDKLGPDADLLDKLPGDMPLLERVCRQESSTAPTMPRGC